MPCSSLVLIVASCVLCALPANGACSNPMAAGWLPAVRLSGWSAVARHDLQAGLAGETRVQPLDIGFTLALEWAIGRTVGPAESVRDGRPPDEDAFAEPAAPTLGVPFDSGRPDPETSATDERAIEPIERSAVFAVEPGASDSDPPDGRQGRASPGHGHVRRSVMRVFAARGRLRGARAPDERRRLHLELKEACALLRLEPSAPTDACTTVQP